MFNREQKCKTYFYKKICQDLGVNGVPTFYISDTYKTAYEKNSV
jgi:hypothetical protein